VFANDTAGNMGVSSTASFIVDTTPPSITSVSQTPTEENVLPENEVNITVTDTVSGVKQVMVNYTVDHGIWVPVDMTQLGKNVWTATIPAFLDRTNVTYRIIATDSVDNTITTEKRGYEYQSTVPEFPSQILLPVFIIVIVLAVIVYNRKRSIK
jgi:hypothetical protein